MNKRFNLRFALILVGSLAVVATGTHFLHAYQVGRTSGALLARAEQVEQDGDLEKAVDYLGRYVALNPTDTDALARYGMLLAKEGAASSRQAKTRAWLVLNRVLIQDKSRNDVRRQVVRLAMEFGQFDTAKAELNQLIEAIPNESELYVLRGQCFEAEARYVDARTDYEAAARAAPRNLEAYERLARLLREQTRHVKRPKEPRPDDVVAAANHLMIVDLVEHNRESFRAYLLLAQYRLRYGVKGKDMSAEDAAAMDIKTAKDIAPDEPDVFLAVADLARAKNHLDEARRELYRGRDLHPEYWRLHLWAARLDLETGAVDAALNCLREGLKKIPRQPELRWELAYVLTVAGRTNEANAAIAQLKKDGFPAAFLDSLDGRLKMQAEEWGLAIELLEKAYAGLAGLAGRPGNEAAGTQCERAGVWLGQCFDQIGDADRAFDAYSRVIGRNEKSALARYGMAMARWSQGRLDEAVVQYRQLMTLSSTPPDAWRLGFARLVLLVNLNNPDRPEVENALRDAEQLKSPPAAAGAVVLRAEYWAAKQDLKKARETLLAKYGNVDSRPVEVWIALSVLAERENRPADALALFDEAQQRSGDGVDLRLARARYWVRRGPAEAKGRLTPLADGVDQLTTEGRRRLFREVGAACVQAGQTAEARTLWERLAAETSDLQIRLALFDLAARAGNREAEDHWVRELQRIEGPDGLLWRYAKARTLVGRAALGDKDGLSEARALLADVKVRRSRWSSAVLCDAYLNDVAGVPDVALSLYQRAIELGEHDPATVGRTLVLLHQRRRNIEAGELLNLLDKRPSGELLSPDTQRAAAEVARLTNKTDALARAERAVAADSKDYHDYLWLGCMRWAARDFKRAESALVQARKLGPAAPEVRTTLVLFLVAIGEKERAVAEVAEAAHQLTAPETRADLARCYELIDQSDRARELYQEALRATPDDPVLLRAVAKFYLRTGQSKLAQETLSRLIRTSDLSTRAWARRTKALMLAVGGSDAAAREALALLDDAGDGSTPGPVDSADKIEEQRTRAKLLALQTTAVSRRAAIKILEGLIERRVEGPQDYVLVGQLYEALNDWPRARQHYERLLALADITAPADLAGVARSMIRHGDADGGQKALENLTRQAPQAPATKEVRARLLHYRGRTAEATALIRECAADGGAAVPAVAAILEEFGDFGGAEEFYRAFAAKAEKPNDPLALAYFLTRRERPAEALDVCERTWSACPPKGQIDVAQACLYALAKTTPTTDQLRRVAARLEAAIASQPDDINLVAGLAAVRNFEGHFEEAVALYRRVLEKDGNHATALNNLAWLLALQGNGPEALKWVTQATKVVGPAAGLLDTRAVANLAIGKPDAAKAAVKDLEGLVADAPTPTTLFHLARAYDQIGQRENARQAWHRAQDKGLNQGGVHPLERPEFDRLAREMDGPPTGRVGPARSQNPSGGR
jgi:tetratricopeptide (TPR) repeat protein